LQAAGEPFENLKHAVVDLQHDLSVFAAPPPVGASVEPSPSSR
jgi:hypothetical protein